MPKGWFESSDCEIQRQVEKGFVCFECFGFKKVKLYIIANYFLQKPILVSEKYILLHFDDVLSEATGQSYQKGIVWFHHIEFHYFFILAVKSLTVFFLSKQFKYTQLCQYH